MSKFTDDAFEFIEKKIDFEGHKDDSFEFPDKLYESSGNPNKRFFEIYKLFSELSTEEEKLEARRNLGISEHVRFRKHNDYIQWQYVGKPWENLYYIPDLGFTWEDFTPENILELQQPALDAIGLIDVAILNANNAANNANQKAGEALSASLLAQDKANDADIAANNANQKAGDADDAAGRANQAAGDAEIWLGAADSRLTQAEEIAGASLGFWVGTQDAYDDLETHHDNILYNIIEEDD